MKKNILILISLFAIIPMQTFTGKNDNKKNKIKKMQNADPTYDSNYNPVINPKDAEKEIIEKDEKGFAKKISPKMDLNLALAAFKKDDKTVVAFIKKLNLDPNYKLYSNNIIIYAVENKLVDSIQELLLKGANIEIKDENKFSQNYGKKLDEIAEKTGDDKIKVLIQAQILNKK